MTSLSQRRLLNQAELHVQVGRKKRGVAIYQQVLRQDPGCIDAWFALAVLLHDAGEFEAAARRLRELRKYCPDLAEMHFNLGTILNSLGQREDAIAAFRRAIELRPDLAAAHNNLGIVYRELGPPEQAMISVARRQNIYEELHVGDVVDSLKLRFNHCCDTLSEFWKDLGLMDFPVVLVRRCDQRHSLLPGQSMSGQDRLAAAHNIVIGSIITRRVVAVSARVVEAQKMANLVFLRIDRILHIVQQHVGAILKSMCGIFGCRNICNGNLEV